MKKTLLILLLCVVALVPVMSLTAQDEGFIFGDPLPTAPELAARGEYSVGVQTLEMVDDARIDLVNATEENPSPMYDRPITVEVWYPATLADGEEEFTVYSDNLGRADVPDSLRPFEFEGRALRDAELDASGAPYPLVIVSHGYPGSRLMMSYLTENLASKGYVVVSIGHTDSTYQDTNIFGSTLLNRSLDQWFVLEEISQLGAEGSDSFLAGAVDAENTGLIGYSMGGYGAINAIGGGYNGFAANFGPGENYNILVAGNEEYEALVDDRIKAAVLFAPWGGDLGFIGMAGTALWDEAGMAGIDIPTFWVVGSQDDVSMFEGVERLFNWSVNSDRTMLVYDNALHNVAPNPPPVEAVALSDYERFADPVWDERTINNINQHFISAFLGYHLKGVEEYAEYLEVEVDDANDAVYSVGEDGSFTEEHTYWAGFSPRTANGLMLVDGE